MLHILFSYLFAIVFLTSLNLALKKLIVHKSFCNLFGIFKKKNTWFEFIWKYFLNNGKTRYSNRGCWWSDRLAADLAGPSPAYCPYNLSSTRYF
jgi:hypothetical protein